MWQRLSIGCYHAPRETLAWSQGSSFYGGTNQWALETSSTVFRWAGIEDYHIGSNSTAFGSKVIRLLRTNGRQFDG